MDGRLRPALLGLAVRLLQPTILPDGHNAEHGQEERVAAGQDVAGVRSHQEAQGGDDGPT